MATNQKSVVPVSYTAMLAIRHFASLQLREKTAFYDIWQNSIRGRRGVRALRVRLIAAYPMYTNYRPPESELLDPIIAYAKANLPAGSWFMIREKRFHALYVGYTTKFTFPGRGYYSHKL